MVKYRWVTEEEEVQVTATILGVSDSDDNPEDVMNQVRNVTGGKFINGSAPTVSLTEFRLQAVTDGAIKFIHEGETAPTFSVAAKDDEAGAMYSAPVAASVTFTAVEDSPTVSQDVFLSMMLEDQTTVITQDKLLEHASDVDTRDTDLSVVNLTVATSNAGTIEDAYSVLTNGVQAPTDVTGLTEVNADAALTSDQGTYAVFKDSSDELFAYPVTTSAGGTVTYGCLLYTSPSPRDKRQSRMPSSA